MKKHLVALSAMLVLLAGNLYAQDQHANQARGFSPNGVFSSFDIDHINLFNGNLVIAIPIGQTYPVGGNLSYSFVLNYNSNLWSQSEVCYQGIDQSLLSSSFFSVWTHSTHYANGSSVVVTESVRTPPVTGGDPYAPNLPRDHDDGCYTYNYPNPATDAGMGWQLTLGKLYPPRASEMDGDIQYTEKAALVYQSPDGGEHTFYAKLHEDDQNDPAATFYTRDGTYLRMRTDIAGYPYVVEFPNGTKHYFQPRLVKRNPDTFENKIVRMEDQFGNWVAIQYKDDAADAGWAGDGLVADGDDIPDNIWEITDSVGRSHTFKLEKLANTRVDAAGTNYQPVVRVAKLDAIYGSKAVYNFNYATADIPRAEPHVPDESLQSNRVIVPFLTSVKLPHNSQYTMALDPGNPTAPTNSYDITEDAAFSDYKLRGVIRGVTLPTGGRIEWEYKPATPDPSIDYGYRYSLLSTARHYLRWSVGVRRRIVKEGSRSHVWTYTPKLNSFAPGCTADTLTGPCARMDFTNTLTTPEGDYTVNYFSIYPNPITDAGGHSLTAPHVTEYGLPFTKDLNKSITDALGKPLFLSTEVYGTGGSGLKRRVYVRYETDKYPLSDGWGSVVETNARELASRTVYDDDGGRYAEVQRYNFDGLGHYRTMETFGNFGAGDRRIEVVTYNPLQGTYQIDPTTNQPGSGHSYQPFPTDRPWVLGTFDKQIAGDFSQRSTTYFNFNQSGLLLAKRSRNDLEPASTAYLLSANDVLVQYAYDANGNTTSESYFGGDRQGGLSTAVVFPSLNDLNGEYRLFHTYPQCGGGTLGVLKSSEYAGAGFKTADYDLDCSTGLIKVSRDTAGNATTYFYDQLSRVTDINTQQGSATHINYNDVTNGSQTGAPSVNVFYRHSTANNTTLAEEEYRYGQLGRLITEKVKMPNGTFAIRDTSYNGLGWVTSVSEWLDEIKRQQCADNDPNSECKKKTTYSNFDPFGRPTKITLPDGKTINQFFSGVREIYRNARVGTSISSTGVVGEELSEKWERYDGQGQLSQVEEQSGAGGARVTTTYSYNVLGKLAWTCTGSGVSQCRSFAYNGRGNLTAEAHPERGWSQYSGLDTMGNVGTSYDGAHWLNYAYDNIGRPVSISELVAATSTWRPVKEFSYYGANGGTGGTFARGKPATSTRHNYVLNPYTAHQNVAVGKPATQSSTAFNSPAAWAVDGNTNGNWGGNSLTHTDYNYQAWWQVDLGASYQLDQVNVWNRTDCCGDRLSNFYVLVSDQPFTSTDLTTTLNQSGVSSYYVAGQAGSPTNVVSGRTGRYVRVQLAGTNYLSLAEVQVIGSSPTPADVTLTEQYTYSGLDGRVSKRATWTNVPDALAYEQSFAYDQLGSLSWQSYPKCTNPTCTQSGMQRPWTVSYGYANGLLTSVGGGAGEGNTTAGTYATSLTYNANQTVASVAHRNGVIDREAIDPRNMQRPAQITATLNGNTILDTGAYAYDGAGNITRIGRDWFIYDKVGRLKEGTALFGTDPLKSLKQQYDYDTFGNKLTIRTYNNVSLTAATLKDTYTTNVISSTNRQDLNYDAAGNVLGLKGAAPTYSYDAFNMMSTAPGLTYLYGPNDERLWIVDTKQNNQNDDNEETYTLRGLNNEVLREYKLVGGNAVGHWFWQKDYVYRGGKLLAAETGSGVMHYHVDHLGSPRLLTDANGTAWERLQFLPFGENSGYYQNGEYWSLSYIGAIAPTHLRFTGHEKDWDIYGLDYMHARHYWERGGRFMSIDPDRDVDLTHPQSWNLYSYVRNNPMNATDPDGRSMWFDGLFSMASEASSRVYHAFSGHEITINLLPTPPMSLSREGAAHMIQDEGHARHGYGAYDDMAKGKLAGTCVVGGSGNCTIGFGHNLQHGACTAGDCRQYAGMTRDQALALFQQDQQAHVDNVNALLRAPVNQAQFDSLVDFDFNVRGGLARPGFSNGLTALKFGLFGGVASEMRQYVYGENRTTHRMERMGGLVTRRGWDAAAFDHHFHIFP